MSAGARRVSSVRAPASSSLSASRWGRASDMRRRFRRPTWPGGMSGVTIGIGYDLGMTPKAQIRSDWERHLSESELAALLAVQGVTGAAVKRLLRRLAHIVIPFAVAEEVFYLETLPRFAARTRAALPGVTKLPADAQGAMLSLVYNRGLRCWENNGAKWPRLPGCCVRPNRISKPSRGNSNR